jgi:hypothetical protein
MANTLRQRSESFAFDPISSSAPIEVIRAQAIDWDVTVDAYLAKAARVGRRYAALVYADRSGASENGTTIATPELEFVESRLGFRLMRSASGLDHYVITSSLEG